MDWRGKISASVQDSAHFEPHLDWVQKMNRAVSYMESHLHDGIDYREAAKIAHCSVYHFQRFFSFLAEIPLSEYIRRRRLTLAAFELQNSDRKVIDVALEYGYESAEAFTRAFKAVHGVAPTAARGHGARLKAYTRITFHISIKGDVEMDYRIEQKGDCQMYGIATEIDTTDNHNFTLIPNFWKTCRADGTMGRIREAAGLADDVPLHAVLYDCTDHAHAYMIGYFSPKSGAPKGFSAIRIPAATWAVFPTEELSMAETARQAGTLWKRIFTEWFATSGYELAPAPEMELHYAKGNGLFLTEIWIPIARK